MTDFEMGKERIDLIKNEIHKEIIGQAETVDNLLTVLLTGGNVLLEGMPGLGKTRLVSAISHVFNMSFKRIQFTPDLMPADITGTNIMVRDEKGSSFRFEAGPIFANVILADEINRATPKTQSALLEAMQEHTVTVGDLTYALPDPFFVIATQNPIEQEGTYPLPEAQLDRFAMKLLVEYPTRQELAAIVSLTEGTPDLMANPVVSTQDLIAIRQMIRQIPLADAVMDRALDIVMKTHEENKYIREGASPRAAQHIIRCAKARAFMNGRFNVSFEDIETVALPILRHRLILSFDAISDGVSADAVVKSCM
ncbi:MAG: MoxR family ATPase [Eubacterium sp.]|nr:MoxR family ATPase [Eubacterium sp.]